MEKYKLSRYLQKAKIFLLVVVLFSAVGTTAVVGMASAASCPKTGGVCVDNPNTQAKPADVCGSGATATAISINIGCEGKGNALTDALFAIIRFLSTGVGLIVVASTVWAGIQYSLARDDPSKVTAAKTRITTNLEALLIYIFAYAILNYLIPGQFLK